VIKIKPLSGIGIETIHKTFTEAFSDYAEPFTLSVDQLQHMIERRGYCADLSFGAFADGELVGFTLNGIGRWNSHLTAYDTGTGVIKTFRQQGIAARIFDDSLPVLRAKGVSQYLLEVIKTNTNAIDLYKKAGFQITREFNYFVSEKKHVRWGDTQKAGNVTLLEINDADWSILESFWDFQPSWQNSIESINRKRDHFTMLGLFLENDIVGYGIIERDTGDIPQLAVKGGFRRKGIATTLISSLMEYSGSDTVKMINTLHDSVPINSFLRHIQLDPGFGQYEMIFTL